MHSATAERLFSRTKKLRVAAVLTQVLLSICGGWVGWHIVQVINEKYLFYYPIHSILLITVIVFLLLIRSIALFFRYSETRLARIADEQHALEDRLTTYLELRNTNHLFLSALIEEMEDKVANLSVWRMARVRADMLAPVLFLLFMILAGSIIPSFPEIPAVAARKEERLRLKVESKKLQEQIIKLENQKDPRLEKLIHEFERLALELQNSELTTNEALKRLNEMQEKLQSENSPFGKPGQKKLAEMLRGAQRSDGSPRSQQEIDTLAAELEKQWEQKGLSNSELEQMLQQRTFSPDEIKKMQKAIQDYKAGQAESAKMMAELQRALETARKGIAPGSRRWTANSEIGERELQKQKSSVDDGPGTTNFDVGPQHFSTKKEGTSEYIEDRTSFKYEQIYKGEREKAGSEPLFLKSQWDEQAPSRYMKVRTFGVNKEGTTGQGPNISTQQDTEESAIRQERIPASYQKIVKEYFKSIKENESQ